MFVVERIKDSHSAGCVSVFDTRSVSPQAGQFNSLGFSELKKKDSYFCTLCDTHFNGNDPSTPLRAYVMGSWLKLHSVQCHKDM